MNLPKLIKQFTQRPVTFVSIAIGLPALLVIARLAQRPTDQSISGSTMGTFYSITYRGGTASHWRLQTLVEKRLEAISEQLSNWREGSWIRRFNRHRSTEPLSIPEHAERVLEIELKLAKRAHGAIDPTLGTLINAWGFGPEPANGPPNEHQINHALKATGHEKLELHKTPSQISKSHPRLRLNCSAVAKGYAVDALANLLNSHGVRDYMINLGGDLRARGSPRNNSAWQIGIQKPSSGARGRKALLTKRISRGAMATSGDYRRYRQTGTNRYAHVINPATGRPLRSSLASVTVLAPQCAEADGLATACLVLGPDKSRELILAKEQTEAIFIERLGSNRFQTHTLGQAQASDKD